MKFFIMQAVTKCRQGEVQKVMLTDISKAHLYAPIEGEQHADSALERAKAGKCCQKLGVGAHSSTPRGRSGSSYTGMTS